MLNEKGHEINSGIPVSTNINFRRQPSIQEMVRRIIRNEMSSSAAASGRETFEEADDFVVGDEEELRSPYELDDSQESAPLPSAVAVGSDSVKPTARGKESDANGQPAKAPADDKKPPKPPVERRKKAPPAPEEPEE